MKQYIFGYGSLISMESRERTGIIGEYFIVKINGYKRSWNVLIPEEKTIGLGVERCAGYCCNGVLFEVSTSELLKFDERKISSGYMRREILLKEIEFLGKKKTKKEKVGYTLQKKKENQMKTFRFNNHM